MSIILGNISILSKEIENRYKQILVHPYATGETMVQLLCISYPFTIGLGKSNREVMYRAHGRIHGMDLYPIQVTNNNIFISITILHISLIKP